MQKCRAVAGAAAFCVALGLSSSLAKASDICTALLDQGIRDTSSQTITEARFSEIKSNVCNSNYDTYAKASSQAISGGFDLPGLFGISAGSATANGDYSQKWSHFCRADYGAAMSNADLRSYISTANKAVLHSFDNCVDTTSERFIRYVQPQADGKVFSIVLDNKRQGNPSFTIETITLTVSGGGTMKVQDDCDFTHTFPWDTKPLNSISIVCRKKPGDAVIVNAITTAGNIVPVTVPAVPNPGPTVTDRVAALEGRCANPAGRCGPAGYNWVL